MDLLWLGGGLGLLLAGGYALVRGASGLAASLGVSPVVIGLTVVAFGTSAPELAVNLSAALSGSSGLAFGNVVGSNLANLGFILGMAALLKPLAIEGRIVTREIPMMLLATAAALVLGLAADLAWAGDSYLRGDGVLLLLVFGVFMYTAVGDVVKQRAGDALLLQAGEAADAPVAPGKRWVDVMLVLVGLGGLVVGGELTVRAATALAERAGLSEGVIGLTVVAVGTSLPELATSLIAAHKGQMDIAVGNVIGSNIFNLLFILGVTATIAPVEVPPGGIVDLALLLALSALLLPLTITHGRRLVRWEGALLVAAWIGYTTYRVVVTG